MLRAESIYKKDKNPDTENARNLAYQKVLDNHNAWIAQIETTAGDDLTIIDSTGYTAAVTKVGSIVPQDVPPAPTLRPSSTPGSLRMMVDTYTQNSARIFYNWEISTDGIAFQFLPQGKGGSRRTLSDLELEKKYWFRVSYATVAGSGRPSEAIEIVLTRALTAYGLKKMPKKGKAKLVNGDSPAMKSVSKRAVRAKAA